MSIWRRFIDEMFGAAIPPQPDAPMGPLARRRGFTNPFPVRNLRSPRHKSGQGPTERANRLGSPAWWSWQNERMFIRVRHHSHPHLWRERTN